MTCIIGTWVDGCVVLAADSSNGRDHRPATKLWRVGPAILGGAGDACVLRWMQDHPTAIEIEPGEDARSWVWRLGDVVRARSAEFGVLREGAQGMRWAAVDLIVAIDHRMFVLHDGFEVEEIRREDACAAIGDRTAGVAAFLAASSSYGPWLALEVAMDSVGRASAVVGGPTMIMQESPAPLTNVGGVGLLVTRTLSGWACERPGRLDTRSAAGTCREAVESCVGHVMGRRS